MRSARFQDDFAVAMRRVGRAPGASTTIVLLIALAIAMSGCVFAVTYGLLWKPLPYKEQDRLVELSAYSGTMGIDLGWSIPYVERISKNAKQVQSIGAFRRKEAVRTDESGRYLGTVKTALVQPSVLNLLGARPQQGRLFVDDDTESGSEPVALVSETLSRQLSLGEASLATRLHLGDQSYRVIGVLPDTFAFPDRTVMAWLPLGFTPDEIDVANAGSFGNVRVVARLRDDGTHASVTSELASLVDSEDTLRSISQQIDLRLEAKSLRQFWLDGREGSLKAMLLAVGVSFSVALTNAYSLLLLVLLRRRQEFAVLEAVGATAKRRTVQICIQSALLSSVASAIALALTPAGIGLLRSFQMLPGDVPQYVGLDAATVVAVSIMCMVAAAALASTSLMLQRQSSFEVLRQSGNGQTGSSRVHLIRTGLVMGQIAVTFVLLFATALLIASAHRLLAQDIGFDRSNRLVGAMQPGFSAEGGADTESVRAQMDAWRRVASESPGVDAVAFSSSAPFSENVALEALSGTPAAISEDDGSAKAYISYVSADYLQALGLRLKQGRAFTAAEAETSARVAVIDVDVERRYFGGANPIGRTLGISGGEIGVTTHYTIIGVVNRLRQRTLASQDEYPSVFLPVAVPFRVPGMPLEEVEFVVNSSNPEAVGQQLAQILKAQAPGLRINEMITMEQRVNNTIADLLQLNTLLQILCAVTIVLTAAGLYALLSHNVASRTREYGVRRALGATANTLFRAVLTQGARMVALAILCATPIALLVGALLRDRLHEAPVVDALALGAVGVGLMVVGLFANTIPALRASRVDPMEAIRSE